MHEHQLETLKRELKRSEYVGLSADEAYALITTRKPQTAEGIDTRSDAEKRLTSTRYVVKSYWDSLRPKDQERLHNVVILPDEQAEQFAYIYGQDKDGKGGQKGWDIPGFPNKVRRAEFDIAWGGK